MVASKKMPGAISNRVFANWWTWAKGQNGDLIAAFTPHEDFGPGAEKQIVDAALKTAKDSVLGKSRGFYRIKTLAPNVCRVTLVAQGSLGGNFTKKAMAWAVKSQLVIVKELQDKYMRNGARVDAEMRRAFPPPPPRGSLTSEQARAVKGSWVELKSTSPFVSISLKYIEPEGKESSVALGKAKTTLDCSAKEAFAYQFATCGREKMRISEENGSPASFVFKEQTRHDFEVAHITKMPFPLTNREFLGRYLSFKEPAGDLVLVFEALPDSTKVDYGANLKVVRGKTTGVVRFKSINDDTQCEVTLVQHGDAGGFVPERVMVAKIPQALRGVADMRELFQRDEAIDGAKQSELAAIINTSKQPYLPDEVSLVDKVSAKFASLSIALPSSLRAKKTHSTFEKLDSPDPFVHMSVAFKEGSSNAIGRASTIVDAPIAEVAAWEMAKMSRENQKEHVAAGGLDRNLKKINDHQNIFHGVYDLSIPKFLPRQFVQMVIWKWVADKKELVVVADSIEHNSFPERKEYLRASSTVMIKYKQEADVGEIPQTKVTWTQEVDLGGVIPKLVQNRQVVGQLMYLSRMRKHFDRSMELDGKKRGELVELIKSHVRQRVEYSEKEEKIVAEGKTWFKAFDGLKSKDVDMRTPLTKGKVAHKKGDSGAWGWSTTTVRTSPEEAIAYLWDVKSRASIDHAILEREVDESPNGHNQLVYKKVRIASLITDRDFLSRMVWKKEGSGYLVVMTYPDEKNKKTPSEAVAHIVKLHKGLSQLSREYPWIVAFLEDAVHGRLSMAQAVPTKLDCVSEAEARQMGKSLSKALRARKTADAAVLQWKKQNPSMEALFEKYPWVEEMVETMGEELLKNAAWGLWFRVITGSGLSMVDLATDINVIFVYFGEEGQEGYGWMMLGMVLASMGLQLALVLVQNGKMGWGKLLREVLITVSGLKP
ncbi:hypothetical protein TeGR_g5792, partial [Tetraparma gracilis]